MNDLKERNRETALAEVSALLKMGDSDATILTATKRIFEVVKALTDRACDRVSDPTISTAMAIRCIARKTEEAMAVIIDLVERGYAYQATALLRPMCEELLFARFIRTIHRSTYVGTNKNRIPPKKQQMVMASRLTLSASMSLFERPMIKAAATPDRPRTPQATTVTLIGARSRVKQGCLTRQ